MTVDIWEKTQEVPVNDDEDVILVRQVVKARSAEIGFNLLDQTRITTAVSELARNMVIHAGRGTVSIFLKAGREGIKLVFEDKGPGIPDIDKALESGFSTIGSMGLGMGGAKMLSDEFEITSTPGTGTTISYIKWA
jgi:serine/threonine-protein kinase RsbT